MSLRPSQWMTELIVGENRMGLWIDSEFGGEGNFPFLGFPLTSGDKGSNVKKSFTHYVTQKINY